MNQFGADILRLWVVGSDYSEDLRIGPEIIKQHADVYRRLRNTLRFMLGNLAGFDNAERLDEAEMPELERWVLHRLWRFDKALRKACDNYTFHGLFAELHSFCAIDLSAFYFDIRKDTLYCDRADSISRRAARTVLDELFNCLTAWMAPFMCFTAEEAWLARHGDQDAAGSVHLRQFPDVPDSWRDDNLADKWEKVRRVRRVVTAALEAKRAAKEIGSSLQAAPTIFATTEYADALRGLDWAEIAITSAVDIRDFADHEGHGDIFQLADEVPGIAVGFARATGEKCERCWRVLDDVGSDPEHSGTCGRCADAVRHFEPLAAE